MTDTDKLAEYEGIIRMLTVKLEELAVENERLRSEGGAHAALKDVYLDRDLPEALRVKAATAALALETPRLMPVQQIAMKAGEPVVPLAELVTARRARQDELCPASVDQRRSDGRFNKALELVPVAASHRNGNGNGSDQD
jgi:hypothetical protein